MTNEDLKAKLEEACGQIAILMKALEDHSAHVEGEVCEVCSILSEAQTWLLDAPTADDWKAIETAPKDGTTILATGLDDGVGPNRWFVCVSWWEKAGYWEDAQGAPFSYLTHWRPIPAFSADLISGATAGT